LVRKALKGFFITTSGFSRPARDYVRDIQDRVILIDGPTLAELLVEHGVGVSIVATYEVNKINPITSQKIEMDLRPSQTSRSAPRSSPAGSSG
jgi:Restriction endonuclease